MTAEPPRRVLRLAHRGDWRAAPENSLAAMLAALAIPACDGLELDVRGSRDGVPVLLHDESLLRVQGVDSRVGALDASELARHGIPTLGEVLAAASEAPSDGTLPFLDVELKGRPPAGVVGVLEAARGPSLARAVVSSFEPEALASIGDQRAAWPRWLNALDLQPATLEVAARLGCRGISVDWVAIDAAAVTRAADAGLEVAAWTVRDRGTRDRLAALGVVAVCAEGDALDG